MEQTVKVKECQCKKSKKARIYDKYRCFMVDKCKDCGKILKIRGMKIENNMKNLGCFK